MENELSGIDLENISIKIKRDSRPIDIDNVNHAYRSHIYEIETDKTYESSMPDGPYSSQEALLKSLQIDGSPEKVQQYLKKFGITGNVYKLKPHD